MVATVTKEPLVSGLVRATKGVPESVESEAVGTLL
jgi:hypothetical protein